MRILLFNQYAGNKGDRAVLYALCKLILEIEPKANITVSTSSPELFDGYSFYSENSIKFIPSAWDYNRINKKRWYWSILSKFHKYSFTIIRESYLHNKFKWIIRFLTNPYFYEAAKLADITLSVGGHHFCTLLSRDLVSSINFDAITLKLLKKYITCFSQTFGPFDFHNQRNLKVTKKILSTSNLYVREDNSKKALLDFRIPAVCIHSTHETVLYLNKLFDNYIKPSDRAKRIGISIYCTQKRTPHEDENYINSIVQLCTHATGIGYEIVFFPMEMKGTPPDDRPYIERIINRIPKGNCTVINEDMQTHKHLKELSTCQIYVGHKTHSTIFALATGTPLIAIAYHPKTIEFMEQYKLGEYAIKESELTDASIIMLFDKLLLHLDDIGQDEFTKSRLFADEIKNDLSKALINSKI